MQIAVLSDIHGNYIALEKCIEYALSRQITTFVFLGDYLGELAYPQKTMDILYSLKEKYECYFIRGNKEDYWIGYEKKGATGWKQYDSTTGALYYTYHTLTAKDMEFYKSLSHTDELVFEGLPPVTICHGSPSKSNNKLLPYEEKALTVVEKDPNSLILCGHIHVQGVFEHAGKTVLNAGAVGVSLQGQGKAQFVILTGEEGKWSHEFVSLEYDVEKVIEDLKTSGLTEYAPCWSRVTEHLLRTGEIAHATVLERAMKLCHAETGKCVWPDIPEKYWEQAVEEMIP
ncbi:MAG: metallophosphoesterase family protein [Lachnospiraceae bacterium]|nr:metallophosphoesterase family protein [Lachnospiraceae bacterium]